jgi:hypothetical protein
MDDDHEARWSFDVERDKLERRAKATLRERLSPFVADADLEAAVTAIFPVAMDFAGSYEGLTERRRVRAKRGLST